MKRKLIIPIIASILSLIVTLVSVSFAWFNIQQNVSVDTISVKVEGPEGMRFSTDGISWGQIVTADNIIDAGGLIPAKFYPVSTTGITNSSGILDFYDVNYNVSSSGTRPTMTSSLTAIKPNIIDGKIGGWDSEDEEMEGYYIVFDLYIETFGTQNVILNAGTSVISNAEIGAQLIARMAFADFGTISKEEYNPDDPTDLTSLTGEGIQAVIFEPNAQWHSSDAIYQKLSSDNGIIDETYVISGIGDDIPGLPLTPADNAYLESESSCLQLANSISYAGASVSQSEEFPYADVLVAPDTQNIIATLEYGYSKLRIFMWLEGQDGDCVNQVTGSDVTLTLKLTTLELLG